jgi:hypothetical protein
MKALSAVAGTLAAIGSKAVVEDGCFGNLQVRKRAEPFSACACGLFQARIMGPIEKQIGLLWRGSNIVDGL